MWVKRKWGKKNHQKSWEKVEVEKRSRGKKKSLKKLKKKGVKMKVGVKKKVGLKKSHHKFEKSGH